MLPIINKIDAGNKYKRFIGFGYSIPFILYRKYPNIIANIGQNAVIKAVLPSPISLIEVNKAVYPIPKLKIPWVKKKNIHGFLTSLLMSIFFQSKGENSIMYIEVPAIRATYVASNGDTEAMPNFIKASPNAQEKAVAKPKKDANLVNLSLTVPISKSDSPKTIKGREILAKVVNTSPRKIAKTTENIGLTLTNCAAISAFFSYSSAVR